MLPPYGRALMLARRAGTHPLGITVILSDRLPPPADITRIAICPPSHEFDSRFAWRPGLYDWRCLAGLPVRLIDQSILVADGPYTPWLGYAVAAEIADFAAYVDMYDPSGGVESLALAAGCYRLQHPERRWPQWWSDARQTRVAANRARWLDEVHRHLEHRLTGGAARNPLHASEHA